MALYVCGVNHRTAALELREAISLGEDEIPETLLSYCNNSQFQEAVMLSTCNRSELYCIAEGEHIAKQWYMQQFKLSADNLEQHFYVLRGKCALKHIVRVACGLDSMVLGEPQIFGQIKQAYQLANENNIVGKNFQNIFPFVNEVTKQIRTETGIGQGTISIASVAVDLAECVFSQLNDLKVLLIGVNEMTALAAKHFKEHGVANISVANRTLTKAQALATEFSGNAYELSQLPEILNEVDLVVTATSSTEHLIKHEQVAEVMKTASLRPMLIIDLAVPRDVDPSIANMDGVYLYNIDDLQKITQEGLARREQAAEIANSIIEQRVTSFGLPGEKVYSGTIRAYRDKVEQIREQELEKGLKQLAAGQAPEQVLEQMARALTKKLMHQPSVEIKAAGMTGQYEFLNMAKRLFGIAE